jgi:hypothetical protein
VIVDISQANVSFNSTSLVSIHRINSKLDFASGQAAVGIRYMLPDEDSPLLFGID